VGLECIVQQVGPTTFISIYSNKMEY
jgi:hypothetical protein